MSEYKLKLDIETSNKYIQAKADFYKALNSISELKDPMLKKQFFCEICREEAFMSITGYSKQQVEYILKNLGIE